MFAFKRSIILGLAALAFITLFVLIGPPEGNSIAYNLSWHAQFSKLFWQGELIPKFGSDLAFGLGGMDFFFYAPLPFYVTATLGEVTTLFSSTHNALAAGGAWMFLASGAAMYYCARDFYSSRTSAIVAIYYMIAPYHLWFDWFLRQSIGEVAAFIFLPLLFVSAFRLLYGKGGFLLFCFSLAGLALSHLPVLLLTIIHFSPIFVVLLFRLNEPGVAIKRLATALLAAILGAGVSTFYWYPALKLLPQVSTEFLKVPTLSPENWLIPISSHLESAIWILLIVLFIVYGFIIWLCFSVTKGNANSTLRNALLGMAAIAFFLNSALAYPIWINSALDFIQFPWRSLTLLDLVIAMLIGMSLEQNQGKQKLWQNRPLRMAVLVTLALGAALIPNMTRGKYAADQPIKMVSALEYFYPTAARSFVDVMNANGVSTLANIVVQQDYTSHITSQTDFQGEVAPQFRGYFVSGVSRGDILPIYFNPNFRVITGDESQIAFSETESGLIRIDGMQGRSDIAFQIPEFEFETVSKWVSLIALIIALFLGFAFRRQN